jgi:hypothetical protein
MIDQRTLPPKIEIKLKYIEASVLKQKADEFFDLLPEFERQSLQEMNK